MSSRSSQRATSPRMPNSQHALYRWGLAGPWADLLELESEVRVQAEDLEVFGPSADLGRWGQPVALPPFQERAGAVGRLH